MKRLKKLASFVLAVAMIFTLAMPVFAATTTNITVNGTGTEYKAWRLLNATDGGAGKFAYTLNDKYTEILKTVTTKTSEVDIVAHINSLNTPDYAPDGVTIVKGASEKIREFADNIYRAISSIGNEIDADVVANGKVFENVPQGYYLIAETDTDGDNDSHSLVMLDTAGNENITVTSKEAVPTLVKEVKETNDTTGVVTDWQEAGSYDIGDYVPFKLTGTLPSNYANYTTYSYTFHDTLAAGLTLNQSSIEVFIDGKKVGTADYTVTTPGTDGCSFEITIANLKNVEAEGGVKANANSKITVEYTAQLNDDAVIGEQGNLNTAYLQYSNNPYKDGDTGTTPKDNVIVFTFKIVVNKTDGTNPLKGAGFTLYKNVEGTLVKVGNEVTGADITTFEFTGLDCGKYELVESTVPAGYNKVPALIFTVEPTYNPAVNLNNNTSDVPELSNLVVKNAANEVISGAGMTFDISSDKGTLTTTVVNNSGTELPSTGGIGTTIFTVSGIGLMVLASVLYVTKRKASDEEK